MKAQENYLARFLIQEKLFYEIKTSSLLKLMILIENNSDDFYEISFIWIRENHQTSTSEKINTIKDYLEGVGLLSILNWAWDYGLSRS